MKPLFTFILVAFIVLKANAQHDSTYTYIGIDSSSSVIDDTISSTTLEQHIDSVFMNLDTEYITTGINQVEPVKSI